MLEIYATNIANRTTLFPGMERLLEALESRRIQWGVVTNKPARFTEPLMEALKLSERSACIVSGDTTDYSKPHPEPLLHACRLMQLAPTETLYVGDARRDIDAGRAAGMRTLAACFGYIGEQDSPDDWQADGLIESPGEILRWIRE